jgi:hypothetical protein
VNSWKVILATIVIFGAGVVTGGLLVNHVTHPRFFHPPFENPGARAQFNNHASARPRSPESLSKQFLQQLDERLQLTPQQHKKIAKILAQGQEQMKQVMQDSRRQIREQLTPEQLKKFETMLKQFRAPHHPPPPPTTNTPPPRPSTNPPPGNL